MTFRNIKNTTVHFLLTSSVLLGIAAAVPQQAHAQLATFDAASFANLGHIWNEDVSTSLKISQEIQAATAILNNGLKIYGLAMQETQFLKKGQVLQAVGFLAQHAQIPGHQQWDSALTAAGGMAFAANSVQQMMLPGQSMQNRIAMAASFSTAMLNSIGSCNAAAASNSNALAGLQQMAMDMNPSANTQSQQANIANLSMAQQLQMEECKQNLQQQIAKAHMLTMMERLDRDQSSQANYTTMQASLTNNPMGNSDPAADLTRGMN